MLSRSAVLPRLRAREDAGGQWQAGDPAIVIVSDAGYDATRLAWVLRVPPVELSAGSGLTV
ncbi:hypothetical protein SAVIM338S_00067 [Streptomyces avidinii]